MSTTYHDYTRTIGSLSECLMENIHSVQERMKIVRLCKPLRSVEFVYLKRYMARAKWEELQKAILQGLIKPESQTEALTKLKAVLRLDRPDEFSDIEKQLDLLITHPVGD